MTSFCKSENCPSSDELLDFQKDGRRDREISRHLAACEFCSAEIAFYARYPQDELGPQDTNGKPATTELAGIPAPLFQLAEALLKNCQADTSSLDALLKEKRRPIKR